MFKGFYNNKDRVPTGVRTTMAYALGKSLEWISRQMKWGGIPCRAEEYFRWYCAMREGDASAADEMHELLNQHVQRVRGGETTATWCEKQAARQICTRAAAAVNALNDDEVNEEDEHAILDLKVAVDAAAERIVAKRQSATAEEKGIRIMRGQQR